MAQLRAVIVVLIVGVVALSAGMFVWQRDFAETQHQSRYMPPVAAPTHDGVPQSLTDEAPFTARVIATIQGLLRAPDKSPDKPTVNRGGFTNRQGFDIRYTKRPGD